MGQIVKEWTNAITSLKRVSQGISVFGSARTHPKNKYYKLAYETCKKLSNKGYDIITGGGPGIMEAANKGATEGKGKSIGLLINIEDELFANKYVEKRVPFEYFFTRKITFARYGSVYIVFPGGFGTLDELYELLCLMQTKKLRERPLILVGKQYWYRLLSFHKDTLIPEKTISKEDLGLIEVVETSDEVVRIVDKFMKKKGNLRRGDYI